MTRLRPSRIKRRLDRIRQESGRSAAQAEQRKEAGSRGKAVLRKRAQRFRRVLAPWIERANESPALVRAILAKADRALINQMDTPEGTLLDLRTAKRAARAFSKFRVVARVIEADSVIRDLDAGDRLLDALVHLSYSARLRLRFCSECRIFYADLTDAGLQKHHTDACRKRLDRRRA